MATSQRTIEQVRSILGKLDRRIDVLREQRNDNAAPGTHAPATATNQHGPLIGAAQPQAPVNHHQTTAADNHRLIGAGSSQQVLRPTGTTGAPALTPPAPSRSPYGKATPLRPAGQ